MLKLSSRHIKKISKRDASGIVSQMKSKIKKEPAVIKKFKEYGVSLNAIDQAHVEFCPLDVSAKTKNKKIYINEKFMDDIDKALQYLVHEAVHLAQQLSGNLEGADAKDYLDKDTEEAAFETQLDFIENNQGEEKKDKYLDDLLDYHGYKGKEKEKKKEELD